MAPSNQKIYDMEENRINDFFNLYSSELAKIRLIGLNNSYLYQNFPESIPQELKRIWSEGFDSVLRRIESGQNEIDIPNTIPSPKSAFFQPFQTLFRRGGDKLESQQLIQIAHQQELIMYLAYIEAFFQDYRRILFKIDPLLLSNKDKTCTWEEIIAKKSIEEIHEFIIEKSLEKSGYDKLDELIEKLNNKPYVIKIRIKSEYLAFLGKLICIRNMIIHNNAKVTKEFKKLHPVSKLKIGDIFSIDFDFLFIVYNFLIWVVFESFAALKVKYYKCDYSKVCAEFNFIENYNPDLTVVANMG